MKGIIAEALEQVQPKLEERKKIIPFKRFAKAEEIAAAALFLASEKAGYITGTVMPINAGMVMK